MDCRQRWQQGPDPSLRPEDFDSATRLSLQPGGLSLPAPVELFDLGTQSLVAGVQLGDRALQLGHERQQLLTTDRREVFSRNHGMVSVLS